MIPQTNKIYSIFPLKIVLWCFSSDLCLLLSIFVFASDSTAREKRMEIAGNPNKKNAKLRHPILWISCLYFPLRLESFNTATLSDDWFLLTLKALDTVENLYGSENWQILLFLPPEKWDTSMIVLCHWTAWSEEKTQNVKEARAYYAARKMEFK